MPNEKTTNCFKLMKNHSPSINKVVIITHGFLDDFGTEWLHTMKDSIQTVEPNTAVIIIGWGRGMVSLHFETHRNLLLGNLYMLFVLTDNNWPIFEDMS